MLRYPMQESPPGEMIRTTYAGFWLRAGALVIDTVLLTVIGVVVGFVVGFVFGFLFGIVPDSVLVGLQLFSAVLAWLYYAIQESSRWQATIGKRFLNLRVTDVDGRQISFARATGRVLGKFLSFLTFGLGYVMAGFTDRRQALHDMIAGCLVLRAQLPAAPPPEIRISPPPPS